MSRVMVACGSAANSSQLHGADGAPRAPSVKLHLASGVCGVGPADSTGKSRVSYWPGGRRAADPESGRRPRKPREMGDVMLMLPVPGSHDRGRSVSPSHDSYTHQKLPTNTLM